MRENTYKRMLNFMCRHKILKNAAITLGKTITIEVYIFYPMLLVYLYSIKSTQFLKILLIPLVSFIVLSIIRYFLNMPRPYEKYDIKPLYNKKTKGKSCPSRHTFSAFVIGFSVMYVSFPLGALITFLAIILAITRVVCGIHFIRDVVWGLIAAVLSALMGLLF